MSCEEYRGLDYFRYVAAAIVIAIHVMPFSSFCGEMDTVAVRIAGRVAVPFFIMITGYFVFGLCISGVYSTIKKLAAIYLTAIIIYLPLNIYSENNILIKSLLFDGTMYHLWYFPGMIIGIALVWAGLKYAGIKGTAVAAFALYVIGMLGDSYRGVIQMGDMQNIFTYTRNGIFYVPIFLVMGAVAKEKKRNGLVCLLYILMIIEGILVHSFANPRHDSMYIMLIPLMYVMFQSLLTIKGKRLKSAANITMCMYIIHPWWIAIFHMILPELNSAILYIGVAGISLICGIIFNKLCCMWKGKHNRYDRAWMEISYKNLKHNYVEIMKIMPEGCQMMAVVKAQAYGHGAVTVSKYLEKLGVGNFAVATIDEAIELRDAGLAGDILILGYTGADQAAELVRYNLIQTCVDFDHAKELNSYGKRIRVHIKIDTGMHRLGFQVDGIDELVQVFAMKNLKIDGIFSHLCSADSMKEEDTQFTYMQINTFAETLRKLKNRGIEIPATHIQSSYGLLNYPQVKCNFARIGIALYGDKSALDDRVRSKLSLKPVLTVKARITSVRDIGEHEAVGYGRKYISNHVERIATVSIGYADGIPRAISNTNAHVIIHGVKAPVIGMLCMDQMIIDVSEIENVQREDCVTIIGGGGEICISAEEVAFECGTITNELLSRMGTRLRRKYLVG